MQQLEGSRFSLETQPINLLLKPLKVSLAEHLSLPQGNYQIPYLITELSHRSGDEVFAIQSSLSQKWFDYASITNAYGDICYYEEIYRGPEEEDVYSNLSKTLNIKVAYGEKIWCMHFFPYGQFLPVKGMGKEFVFLGLSDFSRLIRSNIDSPDLPKVIIGYAKQPLAHLLTNNFLFHCFDVDCRTNLLGFLFRPDLVPSMLSKPDSEARWRTIEALLSGKRRIPFGFRLDFGIFADPKEVISSANLDNTLALRQALYYSLRKKRPGWQGLSVDEMEKQVRLEAVDWMVRRRGETRHFIKAVFGG